MYDVLQFPNVSQILLARGLQRETASRGTLALYTQVRKCCHHSNSKSKNNGLNFKFSKLLFATVLERLIFGTVPSLLSILGAAIIMSSAIYIAVGFALLCDKRCIQSQRFDRSTGKAPPRNINQFPKHQLMIQRNPLLTLKIWACPYLQMGEMSDEIFIRTRDFPRLV